MNPLQRRLGSLRRRLRFLVGWRGVCALLGAVVGAGVLAGLLDWMVDLPSLIRALVLVGILGGACFITVRLLAQPLTSRCDDLSLALQIEGIYPELNDALASTVQFLQQPEDSVTGGGSRSMRQAAIQKALDQSKHFDFNRILDFRGLAWTTAAAIVALSAAGFFFYRNAERTETAFLRLADPFGGHTWTRINLDSTPELVAQGQPYVIKGTLAGIIPEQAKLEVEGTLKTEKLVPVKKGSLVTAVDMTQQKGEFKFRLHAGDAVFPAGRNKWHTVKVLPPPKFVPLDGLPSPQIELRFPEYTDLPSPTKLSPGARHLDVIAGTHVTLRAAFDRPLKNAWIEFVPEGPNAVPAAMLAGFGRTDPLDVLGGLVMGHNVWGRVPARWEKPDVIALEFVPWVTGTYKLHVEDDMGLPKDFVADLRVQSDPVPVVNLAKPGSSLSVLSEAEIAFKMLVTDEVFAIRSVFLEYRRKNGETNQWLDDGPSRVLLYHESPLQAALDRLARLAAVSPIAALPPVFASAPVKMRPRDLDIGTKWALANRFKEGEVVVLQVGADDFCDLFPSRLPGRSHEVELRIVGKKELANVLDEGLAQAQQELVRMQQMQEEALNLVKQIKEKLAKGEAGQKELDKLIEAEQIQKQLQERLNDPDKGLRQELAKLQQLMKDNKLQGSETQDMIKTLKIELDRLAQQELPQIDPNLAEARKELIAPKQDPGKEPKGKDGKTDKGPLDKAQKGQENAKKTLDELAKFLDPFASLQLVKGKTRQLMNQQNELKKDTEKTQDQKNELAKKGEAAKDQKERDAIDKAQDELAAELGKKAEQQNALADKAQDLVKMMKAAQEKRAQDGDKDSADKLKQAAKIADQAGLPQEMRDAAKQIPDKPNDAIAKQGQTAKTLEKMLAALDKQKDDDIDRLKKKQKNAAEANNAVDKIAQAQEKLQKKVKDAAKIENPAEREKALKKLAEEQEKLAEDAKKAARELAMLQEDKASKDLNKAGQEMEKAAEKLAGGQNPEEDQAEALKRIEDAQAKLQQFEEELAREQLAKIADRIKGLKERQDAAIDRSKELHKKVLDKKKWSSGLLETLGGDIISQQGLAGETRSLLDKIKEAKVFAHIFEKAAKAMDESAQAMEARKEAGKDRRFAELEKDELADENKKAKDVEKLQTLAAQRLQRLLDSLKNEPQDVAANNQQKKDDMDGGGGMEQGPPPRPGDGIPPLAQLKALRAEQIEINERTKEFAKENPDPNNLTPEQRRESEQLEAEQNRLHQLFQDMIAPPERKGDMP